MIKEIIQKVIEKYDLSFEEASTVMDKIMNGEINNSQMAGLLIALNAKGFAAKEVAGFVSTMRARKISINCSDQNAVDVCGTGGDASGTVNISTASAFVTAGAGVTVAKHGNRSISSNCGSADVLKELGIDINLSPSQTEEALNSIGIAFMFAPLYHPAMKHVAVVRKELSMKTIFNILGPLTNPAGTKRQVIGTYNYSIAKLMRDSLQYLDMDHVAFICTDNKFDEITLTADTNVFEYSSNNNTNHTFTNKTVNVPKADINKLLGGDVSMNASMILDVLTDKASDDLTNVVAANAAYGIYVSGLHDNIQDCFLDAIESIKSGKALNKLNQLKNFKGQN